MEEEICYSLYSGVCNIQNTTTRMVHDMGYVQYRSIGALYIHNTVSGNGWSTHSTRYSILSPGHFSDSISSARDQEKLFLNYLVFQEECCSPWLSSVFVSSGGYFFVFVWKRNGAFAPRTGEDRSKSGLCSVASSFRSIVSSWSFNSLKIHARFTSSGSTCSRRRLTVCLRDYWYLVESIVHAPINLGGLGCHSNLEETRHFSLAIWSTSVHD